MFSIGGHLRSMGNRKNLTRLSKPSEPLSKNSGGFSSNSGIDFVEDHGGVEVTTCKAGLNSEKQPIKFSPRCNFRKRCGLMMGVGGKQKGHLFKPEGPAFLEGKRRNLHMKTSLGHIKKSKFPMNGIRKTKSSIFSFL